VMPHTEYLQDCPSESLAYGDSNFFADDLHFQDCNGEGIDDKLRMVPRRRLQTLHSAFRTRCKLSRGAVPFLSWYRSPKLHRMQHVGC
jgi:hypothetical protein